MSIAIGIASIPSRCEGLRRVVADLLPQCNKMFVYLNHYSNEPGFLVHPKIEVFHSEAHGNHGCPGKFYRAADHGGYFFAVDDDIFYPSNYVEKMCEAVDRWRACVGVHGIRLRNFPVVDYYSERDRETFRFSKARAEDSLVDILGTGTLAFHTRHVKVTSAWFDHPQLSDIPVAADLQRQGVKRVCVARTAGWLKEMPESSEPSLFQLGRRQRKLVAAVVNSYSWGKLP